MLNLILQDTTPTTFMELFQIDPVITLAVMVLWAVAFMYGWWAISGKEIVPRQLMAITFIIITLAAFMITFYLSPEMYQLMQSNPAQFVIVFLGSGVFGIILLPIVLLMAIGALTGYLRR